MEKKSSGIIVRILLILIGGIFIFEALFTNLKIMFIEAPLIGRESFSLQGVAYLAENNQYKLILMGFSILMGIFGILSFVMHLLLKLKRDLEQFYNLLVLLLGQFVLYLLPLI